MGANLLPVMRQPGCKSGHEEQISVQKVVNKPMATTMVGTHEEWLSQVKDALLSINMSFDDWQSIWRFDFRSEYDSGTSPNDAAEKANRFWWYRQNKWIHRDCVRTAHCWLPRRHRGVCQSVS